MYSISTLARLPIDETVGVGPTPWRAIASTDLGAEDADLEPFVSSDPVSGGAQCRRGAGDRSSFILKSCDGPGVVRGIVATASAQ
jgi:hypothetical protein